MSVKQSFILLFLFPILIYSQSTATSAGTSSNLFLRSGVSARVTGLAGAFTARADDENAIFYNPAGLIKLPNSSVSVNHTEWLQDIRFDNIILAHKFLINMSAALSISHMWLPAIQGRNELGLNTEQINISSSIINLGLAYKINSQIYIGTGIKYFSDNLAGTTTNGFAFDAGLYASTFLTGLSFGLVVQNLAGEIKYIDSKQKVPLTYRAGVAYKIFRLPLHLSFDIIKSSDTELYYSFGTEYIFDRKYSIRLGNQIRQNSAITPAFGVGIKIKEQYTIYYSFSSLAELGSTQRLGFRFNFNHTTRQRLSRPSYIKRPLLPPKKIVLRLQRGNISIKWEKGNHNVSYNIYAKGAPSQKWKQLNKSPIKDNFIVFKNAKQGKVYTFCITSVINNQESTFSKEARLYVK